MKVDYKGFTLSCGSDMMFRVDGNDIPGIFKTGEDATTAMKIDHDYAEFYPDVPWIAASLQHLNDLRAEENRLTSALSEFRITAHPGGYGRPKDITEVITALSNEVTSVTKKANATTLEKQLENVAKEAKRGS